MAVADQCNLSAEERALLFSVSSPKPSPRSFAVRPSAIGVAGSVAPLERASRDMEFALPSMETEPALKRHDSLNKTPSLPPRPSPASAAVTTNSIACRLPDAALNAMTENVVASLELPLSIATNFTVNGRDYLVPMVTEESSVVAAASLGAKLARPSGGFECEATDGIMTSQVVLRGVTDPEAAVARIQRDEAELIALGNAARPSLVKRGCGVRKVHGHIITTASRGRMVSVHIDVDVGDCMGANTVNIIAEHLAPELMSRCGGIALLKVVSNICEQRTVTATARWTPEVLEASVGGRIKGDDIIEAILDADEFAHADPYRAATANKGVMNGVIAVALAATQDTRALEAACHVHAVRDGHYDALTRYRKLEDGSLEGTITIPAPLGVVGAALFHPTAKLALKILGLGVKEPCKEFACVVGALALAQNFAALRALVTGGFEGHMRLHAKNLAIIAGATGENIDRVADELTRSGDITATRAAAALAKLCTIL